MRLGEEGCLSGQVVEKIGLRGKCHGSLWKRYDLYSKSKFSMVVKILKMIQGFHMGLQVAFAFGYYREDSELGQESSPPDHQRAEV